MIVQLRYPVRSLDAKRIDQIRTSLLAPTGVGVVAMLGIIGALYGPLLHPFMFSYLGTDYLPHIALARTMVIDGAPPTPHFLYHLFIASTYELFRGRISFGSTAFLVTLLIYLSLGVVLFWMIYRKVSSPRSYVTSVMYAALSVGLMLVAPITMFTWGQKHLYFGYIAI